MNGQPASAPILYTFPKADKIDRPTGRTYGSVTIQAAVAAVAGHAGYELVHVDELAARLLAGETLWTAIHGYRSQRHEQVNLGRLARKKYTEQPPNNEQ